MFTIPTLEEELQLVQGLNRSTGREVGIYPEIKAPAWHRRQGRDISAIVLEVLARTATGPRPTGFSSNASRAPRSGACATNSVSKANWCN